MVDYFALGITHLLLALAAWRLMARDDLDSDPDEQDPRPAIRKPATNKQSDNA